MAELESAICARCALAEELEGAVKPELSATEVLRRTSRHFCHLPHYIGYP